MSDGKEFQMGRHTWKVRAQMSLVPCGELVEWKVMQVSQGWRRMWYE